MLRELVPAPMPLRLTMVLTHPVQYMSPWLRQIAADCPGIDLTVLYGAVPSPAQQGSGFGVPFEWDVPLTDGYRFEICAAAAGKRFDSDSLFGLDVQDIGDRIAATRPDAVLVSGWHSAMQLRALRACRARRIPVLYRGDSTLVSGPHSVLRPLWAIKTRLMLRQFDGYLSVGTHAAEYLRAFGVPEPLIVRSGHCVDNARFGAAAAELREPVRRRELREALGLSGDDFVVLFAGKIQSVKRPLDAVRAAAGAGERVVLMSAGDGELAAATRDEADRLGVRYVARGFLNQSEIPAAFAAADCLILPSASESWGLAVNEAMASGVPCVTSTGVAAARDLIVAGETGYSAPVGDIAALAAGLIAVKSACARGHDFSTACRARVAQFGFEAASAGLLAGVRRVVERRRMVPGRDGTPRVIMCGGGMVNVFGLERAVFEALRVVREQGGAVHGIVNRRDSSRIVTMLESIGASWSTGYYGHPPRRRLRSPLHAWLIVWDSIRTGAGLLRDAWRFRPTHVFLADFGMALENLPALLLLRMLGVPVVMTLQNAPEVSRFYRLMWTRLVNPVVDVFVANSQFTAGELARTGVPAGKARVVYNTAPTRAAATAPAPKNEQRVIYVGQLIPLKGIDLLLDAVALLRRGGRDVTLDVVGDIAGRESEGFRQSLFERADQPDLRGSIRFLGLREDVPALLAASAVHCCPSKPEIREAFGIVNVEAKAAGIPSVVLPTGGLPELITHLENGWICRDASAEAIAEGLEYFLTDDRRRDAAGRMARLSNARFGRDVFAAGWLEQFGVATAAPAPFTAAREDVRPSHGR